MIQFNMKDSYCFDDLVNIVEILRSENGCPWDKAQTHESIRQNFIEEVYEAIEAIDNKDTALLREELGDVLLQIVLHTQMEREKNTFDIDAVCDEVCKKLIVRHPHIFGSVKADTAEEVLSNWDEIKKQTKGQKKQSEVLSSVAHSLPSLMRAQKVQKRAAKVGFDWPDVLGAFEKISEETNELHEAIICDTNREEEIGDLLFAVVNVARHLDVDAERALEKAVDKFSKRFCLVENEVLASGREMENLSLEELDAIWDQVKERK